tara:strand:+ start:811 stop:1113 length:303 start_codon:yes stop_codon:yes gene_type:complete
MATHHNITGELTQELIAAGEGITARSILLTNIHGSISCKVDLYIEKKLTGKFYILKDVELPIGVSLLHEVGFDTATGEFGLYIKLTKSASETPAVDVIIL